MIFRSTHRSYRLGNAALPEQSPLKNPTLRIPIKVSGRLGRPRSAVAGRHAPDDAVRAELLAIGDRRAGRQLLAGRLFVAQAAAPRLSRRLCGGADVGGLAQQGRERAIRSQAALVAGQGMRGHHPDAPAPDHTYAGHGAAPRNSSMQLGPTGVGPRESILPNTVRRWAWV